MTETPVDELLINEPRIDAKPLYEILNVCSRGYKIFRTIYVAVQTGLFDILDEPKTSEEISRELGVNVKLACKMCDVLCDLGLLNKVKGAYRNTELSSLYLKRNSLLSQINVIESLNEEFKVWNSLNAALKGKPTPINEELFFEKRVPSLASEMLCGELQRTVRIIADLPEFKRARKLLDLGGGHGLYAIAFTKLNRRLKAYVFDLPRVLKCTRRYIEMFDAERVEVIPGDFFKDDIGAEYDIVFLSYIPGGKNPSLIPKIHSSLKTGGLFINKQVFYHDGEGSKDPLLDIGWNILSFQGMGKADRIYSFKGDVSFEGYIELLKKYFSVIKVVDASQFSRLTISGAKSPLDPKMIIAKKKS
ncbi:methyltransferase [Candidatus Bathyarchaeota archaeon]|nr:methyltransferase [Candidatus Bathyarchaeota archaeon]